MRERGILLMNHLRHLTVVDKMVIFIETILQNNNCLKEIEANFSHNYPNYEVIFHTYIGLSVSEYINQARIMEAEKLLEHTTLDFKEIATRIGMNGYFEFMQLFKQVNGISPSTYRNQLLKDLNLTTEEK